MLKRKDLLSVPQGSLGGANALIGDVICQYFANLVRSDEYVIKGITEADFKALNNRHCTCYNLKLERYKRYRNGKRVLTDSEVVVEHIPVPVSSVAILTDVGVPKARMLYNAPSRGGCKFVDMVKSGEANYSRYIVPKANLYKVNFASLVVSATRLRNHLGGIEVFTADNESLFLFIVPYKYDSTRVNLAIDTEMNNLHLFCSGLLEVLRENYYILDYSILEETTGEPIAYKSIEPTVFNYKLGESETSIVVSQGEQSDMSVLL